MAVFKKHYTREEARQLLPLVSQWLEELTRVRDILQSCDEEVGRQLARGEDAGGEAVNKLARCVAAIKQILLRFKHRDIQIKDPDRGLIDFPAYVGGKEVFLCWEKGEEDIEFWHDLTGGYAGRERI
jgi:hypothetical protein